MKVVIVNTGDSGGGAERVAWDICEWLRASGQECAFLAGAPPKRPGTVRIMGRADWVLGRTSKRIGLADAFSIAAWRFLSRPEVKSADIIHFHNLHGFYFGMLSIPTIAKHKPVVWTLHDFWALTGGCYHTEGCERWKDHCGNCPQHGIFPMVGLFDTSCPMLRIKRSALRAVCKYGVIVSPCQWLANGILEAGVAESEDRVVVIHNGVDLNIFHPARRQGARKDLGIDPKEFCLLLLAASLSNRLKGAEYAIETINRISRARDLTVLLVGSDADQVASRICCKRKISQGRIDEPARLAGMYAAADAFILSSIGETFPLTILESLACGTPVVAFDVGGVPEQIDEGGTGFVVPVKDTAAMSDAIMYIMDREEKRGEMRLRSRARAESLYSMELFRQRHMDVYSRVAGKGR